MKKFQYFLTAFALMVAGNAWAIQPPAGPNSGGGAQTPSANPRGVRSGDCSPGTAETELAVNNVRARLRNGGDMWWDGTRARYIVPAAGISGVEVSALFAGGIWLGGKDGPSAGAPIITAVATYRGGKDDFYPGPLEPADFDINQPGATSKSQCETWNRAGFFTANKSEIEDLRTWRLGGGIGAAPVTANLRRWPARGNQYFSSAAGFQLPDQNLAPFFDWDGDGIYNPAVGDIPTVEVRGCIYSYDRLPVPTQMKWWVYNDAGNTHTASLGQPMYMEVQVTAFAYSRSDEINNMTFYRYKLLNQNPNPVYETYFSVWSDPDLGCERDDYIGSDTTKTTAIANYSNGTSKTVLKGRDLGIVYNNAAIDPRTGCSAAGYGTPVPALGVDYFRGPLGNEPNPDDCVTVRLPNSTRDTLICNTKELGLSSFMYYYRSDLAPNPNMGDPVNYRDFYNYQQGLWKDGSPLINTGNGFNPAATTNATKFAFPGNPANATEWSMCNPQGGTISGADMRFLHTSGPFTLKPGGYNELITGVVWVPEHLTTSACQPFTALLRADQQAQSLFDNCFKTLEGPKAPDLEVIERNKELILVLSNGDACSKSARCGTNYSELETDALNQRLADTTYRLEGYKIYQVSSNSVSGAQLNDPTKARIVFQSDIKNNVGKVFNWEFDDELGKIVPKLKTEQAANNGLKTTFRVTEDQFVPNGSADRSLVNHRKYYFLAVAYAYNNYIQATVNPSSTVVVGQKDSYLESNENIGSDGKGRPYVGIPRNTSPEYYGLKVNSTFGDSPNITRYDGQGNFGKFLEVLNQNDIATQFANGSNVADRIVYTGSGAPVEIVVHNPLRVPEDSFLLRVFDRNLTNGLDPAGFSSPDSIRWEISSASNPSKTWTSQGSINTDFERSILELGITVRMFQVKNPGCEGGNDVGFVGGAITYADTSKKFLRMVADGDELLLANSTDPRFQFRNTLNYVRNSPADTGLAGVNYFDPGQSFTKNYDQRGFGWPAFYPFRLCDAAFRSGSGTAAANFTLTPGYAGASSSAPPNEFSEIQGSSTTRVGSPPTTARQDNSCGGSRPILQNLRNVNIVLTPDRTKWSRCVVVETASRYYTDPTSRGALGLSLASVYGSTPTPQFELRKGTSLDINGQPETTPTVIVNPATPAVSTALTNGFSWFPGYAYDVVTGERLNVFFGENTLFSYNTEARNPLMAINGGTTVNGKQIPVFPNAADMLFNPNDTLGFHEEVPGNPRQSVAFDEKGGYSGHELVLGGQHFVYVTGTPYDGCKSFVADLLYLSANRTIKKARALANNIQWAGMPYLAPGYSMSNGVPPAEATIKLRMKREYQKYGTGTVPESKGGFPTYGFRLKGASQTDQKSVAKTALDLINVVPNPYYAYSEYEQNENEQIVKFTNLPPKCQVNIYSLEGTLVRTYNRDEITGTTNANYANDRLRNINSTTGAEAQQTPALDWDLKNAYGIPVAGGVYLVHVNAPGVGERTLKAFVITRAFDAQRL